MIRFTTKIRKSKKGYTRVSIPKSTVEKLHLRHGEEVDLEIQSRDKDGY